MKTRTPFEIVLFRWEQLCELCPSAEDFCQAWSRYLADTGWDEETFLQAFENHHTEQ